MFVKCCDNLFNSSIFFVHIVKKLCCDISCESQLWYIFSKYRKVKTKRCDGSKIQVDFKETEGLKYKIYVVWQLRSAPSTDQWCGRQHILKQKPHIVPDLELTKPQTVKRYKNAKTTYNTQHHNKHKINKKLAGVLKSSNASKSPRNDDGGAMKKRQTRNGWHPSAPETRCHQQYSSMAGEGPYPSPWLERARNRRPWKCSPWAKAHSLDQTLDWGQKRAQTRAPRAHHASPCRPPWVRPRRDEAAD
jgi:hypothetical protein